MARLICDNTDDTETMQPLAFKMPNDKANKLPSCSGNSIPSPDLQVFQEEGNKEFN